MNYSNNMPPQRLPFSRKNKAWRIKCVDFGDSRTLSHYSPVRGSVKHKKINYDLLRGVIHMDDLQRLINPENIDATFASDKITHFPIMNSKLNVLRGEEAKRVFEHKVVVTNPLAISQIEQDKKQELFGRLQQLITDQSLSQEQVDQGLQKLNDYMLYEYQDFREVRANCVLNHYEKELNIPLLFNKGFVDAMAVGEEIYQCDIVGGEPVVRKLNPMKLRVYRSGYSDRIEDADMLIYEDYVSPGAIIDEYYEVLTSKDIKYIEELPYNNGAAVDEMSNIDERFQFVNTNVMIDDTFESAGIINELFAGVDVDTETSLLPYDSEGNIRVMRMYWKSMRKIKKIKSYDPQTGEETFTFQTEQYQPDQTLGEEEEAFWINEAWEGTKIGDKIYVNMRPRPVQYNRISNPSLCHFGIIGSIYNINEGKPFSLVDMMKPYSYWYDVIHDKLNKLIARNWGKLIEFDAASIPEGWDVDKWMYFAKHHGIIVKDSFREGNEGVATGKIYAGLNTNSRGSVDAELGTSIQQYTNLLEFIKMEMSEVAGISKQREGQISNRETVGGVERATLQSSHITEWLFTIHDDVKKRVLECLLETAKIAMRGRTKKFQYILPDHSTKLIDIDGDQFAECDYGLTVDSSDGLQKLQQNIEAIAQLAIQSQKTNISTIMKLYSSCSIAEKERMLEKDEADFMQQQQQQQQQAMQIEQQKTQAAMEQKQMELGMQDQLNQRDNETKILVATIGAAAKQADQQDFIKEPDNTQENRDKLLEQMREFDEKIRLDREKFQFEKQKHSEDNKLKDTISKRQAAAKKSSTTNK